MARALVIALFVLGAIPAIADPPAHEIGGVQIGYLNRTWTDVAGEASPVDEGPLSVRLRSPANRVTVHRNRLVLAPRDGGDPDAQIEAEFEGEGDVVADVGSGAFATTLRDRVTAPRQSVRVTGRARVIRDDGAYTVALVDGPAKASVKIQSGVVGDVFGLCKDLRWLSSLDCDRLRESLSTVNVPLGGRAMRLPRESLSAEERAYLDRFVAR